MVGGGMAMSSPFSCLDLCAIFLLGYLSSSNSSLGSLVMCKSGDW